MELKSDVVLEPLENYEQDGHLPTKRGDHGRFLTWNYCSKCGRQICKFNGPWVGELRDYWCADGSKIPGQKCSGMEWVKHRAFEYDAEKTYGPHDSKKKELHVFLRSDGSIWYQQVTQTCDSGCGCREMAKPEIIWEAMRNHLEGEFQRPPITKQEFDEHFKNKMEEMKGMELYSLEATGTKIGDDEQGWGINIRNLRKAQGELWYGQYIPLCKAGKLAYEWLLKYAQCPRYSGIAGFGAKLDESGDVPDNVCRIIGTCPEHSGTTDVVMNLEPRWRLSV